MQAAHNETVHLLIHLRVEWALCDIRLSDGGYCQIFLRSLLPSIPLVLKLP